MHKLYISPLAYRVLLDIHAYITEELSHSQVDADVILKITKRFES